MNTKQQMNLIDSSTCADDSIEICEIVCPHLNIISQIYLARRYGSLQNYFNVDPSYATLAIQKISGRIQKIRHVFDSLPLEAKLFMDKPFWFLLPKK